MKRRITISGIVRHHAERTPGALAILAPGRTPFSYADLWKGIVEYRHALAHLGVCTGKRVALVLPNGPELAVSFLSIASCATATPLNPNYRQQEFEFFLGDLAADALILSDDGSPARTAAKNLNIPVLKLQGGEPGRAGSFDLLGERVGVESAPQAAKPSDVALMLHTSGTTSKPKIVPLRHENLCASARHIAKTLSLTSNDRCLNVMPLFHIHGIMAALLASMHAGASVVCTPGFFAPQIMKWMRDTQPTWYTAVPTMHQAILQRARQDPDSVHETPLRFVRSSSSALPPQLMEELESLLQVPVIESYGMTEASHQMASNPLPPGYRKPGSVGPAAGPEITILNEEGEIQPAEVEGEIVIRGPNVMQGYEQNPEANRQAFSDGWFRTGDLGTMDADGYLFITGRKKEIINRGGEKISPREIDEILLDHPAVSQAVAFAIPDARLGEDVGAAVVLREGEVVGEHALRTFVSEHLADFKVPRLILILEELPKGPTGKLQRIGLAEKLGIGEPGLMDGNGPDQFVPPRSPTEEILAQLWRQVLELGEIGVHDRFLDLGGDSMLATLLLSRVRERLNLDISMIDFFDAPTISAQAKLVEALLLEELEGGLEE